MTTGEAPLTRRWLGCLVVAPLLLLGCGEDDDDASDAATTTTASAEAAPADSLTGTWRTASITTANAEETLAAGGLSEWIDEFRTRAPFEDDTVLILEIGDEWDLYGESADGERAEIDYDASYDVDGDEVIVTHSAGSNTFRWEVDGDTLTLEHLDSTMPAFEGVPEEVFQRALYMTADFTLES